MNPLQKKLFEKKYGHLHEEQVDPNAITQQTTTQDSAKPIFKSTEGVQNPNLATTTTGYMPTPGMSNRVPSNQALIESLSKFNSSKLAIRPSTDYFPSSKKMNKSTQIPLSVMITPFTSVYSYEEFPVANFGPSNPILRCEDCRAYVNPFSQFLDNGNKFKCNICGFVNNVPSFYYCPLDNNGERTDKYERSELCCGTFDIKAGTDYMARPPMPPIYFFVIDVSQKAVENGSIEMVCNILNELISNDWMWGDTRTKIGFIAYDSNIHLIDLNPNYKQPKIVTLTDIESLTKLPVPDNLVVNLTDAKTIVQVFIKALPNMFAQTKDIGTSFTDAVRVAGSILRASGGRMYVIQSNPNVISEKSLTIKGPPNTIDKKTFLIPTAPNIMEMTPDMQQNFVSCSLFIMSNSYKNLITMGELARYLNGDIYYYPEGPERNHKFYFEFKNSLLREYTWESVFRIRISAGWKISAIYGNYSIKSSGDLLSLPNIDDSKSLIYELVLDDEIARSSCFFLQTALLYTNSYGERRIRVINYGIPLTENIGEIHSQIDAQVVACTILRQNLTKLYHSPNLSDIRNNILTKTNMIFTEVCPRTRKNEPIPDSMLTFSMLMLGILKHPIFLEKGLDYNKETDLRNALRIKLNMLNVEETALHFVPYLFAIHTLGEEETAIYDENNVFIFPQLLSLSMNNLSNSGIYLMDDGSSLYMLVGSQVDPTLMTNLFGIKSIHEVQKLNEDMLYHNSNEPVVNKVYNLITELRNRKMDRYAYLYIIKEGERSPAEFEFYSKLIEDKMNIPQSYNVSYADFLELISKPVMNPNAK